MEHHPTGIYTIDAIRISDGEGAYQGRFAGVLCLLSCPNDQKCVMDHPPIRLIKPVFAALDQVRRPR